MMEDAETSRHRRAWDAIPWVVNGSADEAERRIVDAHVADCADCRAELAFQQRLHDGLAPVADGDDGHDAGPALQRFWARVDEAEGGTDAAVPAPRDRDSAIARPAGAVRWLAAAVVVQAIGLAALAGMLWERPRPATYETLSRAPAPAAVPAGIRLVPAPSLSVGELRALLARCGVQITETSADGAILGLALRTDSPDVPGGTDAVIAALARLRAEPGVLLAEPVAASAAVPAR